MGQLGLGNLNDQEKVVEIPNSQKMEIERICCGWVHSIALSKSGQVFTCGASHFDQLAHGDFQTTNSFRKVENLEKIISISAGMNHSLFATGKHTLKCNFILNSFLKPF